MTLAPQNRPRWVDAAIAELERLEDLVDALQQGVSRLALDVHGQQVDAPDLTEAFHDLEHANTHLTTTRRGLVMSWPDQ